MTFNWQSFLKDWSAELIEHYPDQVPETAQRAGWLGFPPATLDAIEAAEQRLKTKLPPSYRDFLVTSNGWRTTGPFIDALHGANEIEWHYERNRDMVDAWLSGSNLSSNEIDQFAEQAAHHTGIDPTIFKSLLAGDDAAGNNPDGFDEAAYLVYGEEQIVEMVPPTYLKSCLAISPPGDEAIYLLNPKVQTPAGEWEAWFFASWLPGARRFRSFREMMVHERQTALKLADTKANSTISGVDRFTSPEKFSYLYAQEATPEASLQRMFQVSILSSDRLSLSNTSQNTAKIAVLEAILHRLRAIITGHEAPSAAIADLLAEVEAELETLINTPTTAKTLKDILASPEVQIKDGQIMGYRIAIRHLRHYLDTSA